MHKISILMPVYNWKIYISEAIESIINQTYTNWELIIIDDCSNDNTLDICKQYSKKNSQIKVFQNRNNIGVVKTRNKLLRLTSKSSKYIAIIDADDIAMNQRLEKQINFLEKNNTYSIIWTNTIIIDEKWKIIWKRKYPKTHNQVKKTILKKDPIAQPSVMIRKSSIDKVGEYNEKFERCQDYELWFRFFDKGYKIGNLQENLTHYRVFSWQGKSKYLKLTLKNTIKIQKKYLFKIRYFNINALIYWLAENILLLFPSKFILFLFKKITY